MGEFIAVAILLMLAIGGYWAFVLFPRQRDFAQRQNMARTLAEGDEVITAGGIIGKVKSINSAQGIAKIELADGLEVRIVIAAMLERYDPEELAKNAQMGQKEDEAVTE
ncbi:MAG: preprotein translocase subunit YajC [Phototrophicaceae bacterium]